MNGLRLETTCKPDSAHSLLMGKRQEYKACLCC